MHTRAYIINKQKHYDFIYPGQVACWLVSWTRSRSWNGYPVVRDGYTCCRWTQVLPVSSLRSTLATFWPATDPVPNTRWWGTRCVRCSHRTSVRTPQLWIMCVAVEWCIRSMGAGSRPRCWGLGSYRILLIGTACWSVLAMKRTTV